MFSLAIHPAAKKEWAQLHNSVKSRLKTKLGERLKVSHVPISALTRAKNLYKIKISKPQVRLAYHVADIAKCVTVLAVTTRDDVYELLGERLSR